MGLDPKRLAVYVVTSADGVPGRTHLDVARAAPDRRSPNENCDERGDSAPGDANRQAGALGDPADDEGADGLCARDHR